MKTALIAGMLLLASSAFGTTLFYSANLSGAAEAPPNASPGTGFALVSFNDVTNILTVDVNFTGLLGNTTASHIHCCTTVPGTGTAGVATQTPTFGGFPLGVTSGTYSNSFDMTLAASYNAAFITSNGGTTASARAAFVACFNSGSTYLNIHTSTVPGGEIRGFLLQTPEPATFGLIGLPLVGLVWFARRRKRA